jgi:hypothetical protein
MGASSALAGSKTWDFTTDPQTDTAFELYGNNATPWMETGGNPGGFLALTYAVDSMNKWVIFPDIDDGKIVTAFTFDADLRVGNSSDDGGRPADGFSISFARSSDPLLVDATSMANSGNFAATLPEAGTATGIAIGFDTWSGNALPDGADIEGIIVRVDNVTVLKYAMPTRNGAATDPTSMQTGPLDSAYWTAGGDAYAPEAWSSLTWQHFSCVLDDTAKLTVTWKGVIILDHYQTKFFPSPGRIVMACRTGGNNENTHMDNIKLVTTAITADTQAPTAPANLKADVLGAYRVVLSWDKATDDSLKVAYEIEQDGAVLAGAYPDATADVRGLKASTSYSFRVRATDQSGNKSGWTSAIQAKTVADVSDTNFAAIKVYGTTDLTIAGVTVADLLGDARYPDSPDQILRLNGMLMSFGEPAFAETFGDNRGFRIAGTVTPTESGNYDFFVRSDDASELYLNTSGESVPVADGGSFIATETGCCKAFLEPGNTTEASVATAAPIALTAGKSYGILFLVKEGGGGDWGQVAWRKVGDTTPAANLPPIGLPYFKSDTTMIIDPVGTDITVESPKSIAIIANSPVTFTSKATVVSPYPYTPIYQWYRDGKIITGATALTYSIANAALTDSGAKFTMTAAVPGKLVTTTEAVLTVVLDTMAPIVSTVSGSANFTLVTVAFSEPMKASTLVAANFAIDNGITVSATKVVSSTKVELITSKQIEDKDYILTVNNLEDTVGNKIASNSKVRFHSFVYTVGKMTYSVWTDLAGTVVTDLTGSAVYTNSPNLVQYLTSYESPVDWSATFGAVISGFIVPKTSGDYVFFVNSDDASELYLSTDETADKLKLIAMEASWSGTRNWVSVGGAPSTVEDKRSDMFAGTKWPTGATISLVAGKRYATQLIYKEGGGGDEGQATWKLASDADPVNGDASLLTGSLIATYAPQAAYNVLSTNDTIVASSTNSPASGNENAKFVLDLNSATKYLNFDKLNTGFTVTPKAGATMITGIALTSANDAPERDPATYKIEGSNDGTTFTVVAEGTVPLFTARFKRQELTFGNTASYSVYRVTFPTVAAPASANSMQVADVELFGFVTAIPASAQPKITGIVKNADGTVTLTWTGGGTLEAATSVSGPYAPVAGATSPYTFTPAAPVLFGRIKL